MSDADADFDFVQGDGSLRVEGADVMLMAGSCYGQDYAVMTPKQAAVLAARLMEAAGLALLHERAGA